MLQPLTGFLGVRFFFWGSDFKRYFLAVSTATSSPPKHSNRLADEKSPYLLQHAHNPVNWFPWGDEAFAAARAKDLPIFLSVLRYMPILAISIFMIVIGQSLKK
jgi:hypothetical protein